MDGQLHYNVICIGAGGTGGNFSKEFARYLKNFNQDNITVSFSLVDGDKVEDKNCARQPFSRDDIALNKAVTLVETIQDVLDLKDIHAYPQYIDDIRDLSSINEINNKAFSYQTKGKNITLLIGSVDNHRARQVMHEFFNKCKNIIYIDSANEYSVGEICIGARINGKKLAPPRAFYYPDVLTDNSPSASEVSCGAMNVSSPQHLATNLMAAHLMLSVVCNIISNGVLDCGIIYFDAFKYFSRFDRYEEKIVDYVAAEEGVNENESSK